MSTAPEATVYRSLALGDTGLVAKDSAVRLLGWTLTNSSAAIRYVKIYNKATAPTASDTPALTIGIPTLQTVSLYLSGGINFPAGISARCTTAAPDNSTAAATAGDVLAQLLYKAP